MRMVLVMLMAVIIFAGVSCNRNKDSSSSGSSASVAAPTNLAATKSATSISFTWQDNSTNETEFTLYIKPYDSTAWLLYTNAIPPNVTAYSLPLSTLTGLNFQFCLTAYDGNAGVESAASNVVTINLP